MIHDQAMSRSLSRNKRPHQQCNEDDLCCEDALATDDRRQDQRVPFPAEMILLWNHDPSMRHRYRILDASDGGYRIHCALPLLEGTTGMVIRLLACSASATAQPVMVAWCKPIGAGDEHEADSGYEVGLRTF